VVEEVWAVVAVEPRYRVSNLGRVMGPRGVMRPRKDWGGYMNVRLGKRIKNRSQKIHRLVAMAFCAGWSDGLEVNHKNGIRDDNRADNLEWVTRSQNVRHAQRVLGAIPSQTGRVGVLNIKSKKVRATAPDGSAREWESVNLAMRDGFFASAVSLACRGLTKSRTYKGLRWEYV
jgi:hypothetical protein